MTWTDERIELLTKLWNDGMDASLIAQQLGGITKNAVIGKAHRQGLMSRKKTPLSRPPKPVRLKRPVGRPPKPKIEKLVELVPVLAVPVEPDPEPIDNVIPLDQRRALMELNAATCRWPIGNPGSPDFFFCGGTPVNGIRKSGPIPYCAYHCRIAYQPVPDRRERRLFRFG